MQVIIYYCVIFTVILCGFMLGALIAIKKTLDEIKKKLGR